MLLQVGEFKERVRSEMNGLVKDLQLLTSRYGESEEMAWRSSLPEIGTLFSSQSFDPSHLYFGGRGSLSIEYQLCAPAWSGY